MHNKIAICATTVAFVGMHFVPAGAAETPAVLPPVNLKPPRIKVCPGTVNKKGKLTKCVAYKGQVLYG